MGFDARVKKLTDSGYSPTNATSEAAIRGQVDGSIQEVYDNIINVLTSIVDSSSGADNVAATAVGDGVSETVQGILEEIELSIRGSILQNIGISIYFDTGGGGTIYDAIDLERELALGEHITFYTTETSNNANQMYVKINSGVTTDFGNFRVVKFNTVNPDTSGNLQSEDVGRYNVYTLLRTTGDVYYLMR